MAKSQPKLLSFNGGVVSPLSLARQDIKRISLSGEEQTNLMPRHMGSAMLRAGTQYIATLAADLPGENEAVEKLIPFIFSKDDTAIISLKDDELDYSEIFVDDEALEFEDVATQVTDSGMADAGSWTDNDDSGATSSFDVGANSFMVLVGTGFAYARRYQLVSLSGSGDHTLAIVVSQGRLTFKIGTTLGAENLFTETVLTPGEHFIRFSPAGNFYIQFASNTKYETRIDSAQIIADQSPGRFFNSGSFTESPFEALDGTYFRYAQSGNVIYFAHKDSNPLKIERRDTNSWSAVRYEPEDGPFLPYNSTGITLTPSALSGDITLTASRAFFKSGHAATAADEVLISSGALFQIDSTGQKVSSTLSGEDQWSNSIRVAGTTRSFFAIRASIGTNTVTLQRSIDGESSWTDIATYTTNATSPVNDGLDNQIVHYRIGIKTGNYTSGSPVVTLEYSEGSISGICRIKLVTNSTTATAIVLREFGGTAATKDWREGAWSEYRGWPSAVALYEGRLWWAGKQFIDGSASDLYETFDDTLEGAGRPIRRSIGFGSADNINWMAGAENLLLATDTRVLIARSSRDDAPLTQDDFGLKNLSSQGASNISPIIVDKDVIYVQNSGIRLMRMAWDGGQYIPIDLTALSPEIGEPSIVALAVQQQPDVRIHCVLSDGTSVAVLFDPVENLTAFIPVETDGDIKDVVVLPGDTEDKVYFLVKRLVNSWFLERAALESECQGGALNKQLDSFILYSGASTTTITGLDHLEGEAVYVWKSGVVQGPFTVASGQITGLTTAVTSAVVGLTYRARFKSVKLGQLMDKKAIPQVGLIMRNVHPLGIKVGQDYDHLKPIPKADWRKTAGEPDSSLIIEDYHKEMIPIDGTWTMDSRLCMEINAPYCGTVLAAIMNLEGNEK